MSLYSQNQYFGTQHVVPGFSQPSLQSGYQYPPPQPPVYHVDPNTFRRDYAARLAELTINSRPIIQNLSMLAQEFSRFSEIVGQCIDAHIRRVPPWMKLPAFYLLDAISKNVYEPYARQFSTFVIPLFLETYNLVDQNTRSKMEEMLMTWRTGSPTGKELFGVVPQVAIERGVWGGESTNMNNHFHTGQGQIQKSQVLSELEFTLGQKERALHLNPYDSVSQNHANVLHQLRKLVEAGVSQEELQQILNQLRSFARSTAPPPPPMMPPPPHAYPVPSTSQLPPIPMQAPLPSSGTQPPYPPINNVYHQPAFPYLASTKSEAVNSNTMLSSQIASSSSANAPVGNLASLFNALVKAGVVSANSTPTGAGATSKEEAEKEPSVDLERESARVYRKSILSHKIKLTSADITKNRPPIISFLYDELSARCKQCGIRFNGDSVGKKKMEDHLDMHFRQNRKANQNIGRGHSRSWFIGAEDWTHDLSLDSKGKGRADRSRLNGKAAAAAAELAERDAELQASYVVVPPGDEAKAISCPICKEILKSEFLEENEDWVWKNAVMKDDRVYHATCHAEAVASTNSLAARLRTEIASRSRSGTPEVQSSRSTPPKYLSPHKTEMRKSITPPQETNIGGMKRKAETDVGLNSEIDDTPPMKRLALSA